MKNYAELDAKICSCTDALTAKLDGSDLLTTNKTTCSVDKTLDNGTYTLSIVDRDGCTDTYTITVGAKPTAPAPTEAAPTEAAPTEAAPTEVAPTEAAPTDAVSPPTQTDGNAAGVIGVAVAAGLLSVIGAIVLWKVLSLRKKK